MKRYFSNSAILLFFCFLMGAIIMADCIMAVGYVIKERGIASQFSDNTIRFTILQPQSQESFLYGELKIFLENCQERICFVKETQGKQGVELYINEEDYFPINKGMYGVWLSEEIYDSLKEKNSSSFFYNYQEYNVLGYYKEKFYKDFVIDMRGELSRDISLAMNGTYYLDGKEQTVGVYHQLVATIQEKNPSAQILLEEEQENGYLFTRMMQTEDSLYYFLQMGLLLFLNIINFGNIVGYWTRERRKELFVRRLTGGTINAVYVKMIMAFMCVVATAMFLGCIFGGIVGAFLMPVTVEGIGMGVFMSILQSVLLFFLGSIVLYRNIHLPIIELKKE